MSSLPAPAAAQPSTPRQVHAARATTAPVIDGRLDDAIWQSAEAVSGFLQRDPVEGEPASEETVVRIAYDDHALYVGARLVRPRARPPSCGSSRVETWPSRPTRSSSISILTTIT